MDVLILREAAGRRGMRMYSSEDENNTARSWFECVLRFLVMQPRLIDGSVYTTKLTHALKRVPGMLPKECGSAPSRPLSLSPHPPPLLDL